LSIQIDPAVNSAIDFSNGDTQPLSLAALVEALKALTSHPSLKRLYDLLENAHLSEDELRSYIGFKVGNYARHRVFRNQWVEMLVLCWQPGHRTPIHDHNGSHGAVLVQQGVLWETTFTFDEEKGLRYNSVSEYQPGAVTGAEVPDIHQLGNPDVSEQNLITIHIYAPPLGVLHTYKPGSAKIDLYTPDDSDA
jgi:cysteine dioxygenase